jgi:glycosyltransferase involved in cell wall biosynthesis
MKIGISIFENIAESSGLVTRLLRIVELLNEGHDVTVIARVRKKAGKKNLSTSGWVIRIPLRIIQSVWWNLKLSYIVFKNKFDIVYSASDYYGILSLYIWSIVRHYKVIYEAQIIIFEYAKENHYPGVFVSLIQIFEKLIIRRADYIVALSPHIAEFCQMYNDRVELIPLFVDDALFKSRTTMTGNKEIKKIGLIGPFNTVRKRENLHFLYSNMERFDKRITFVIIGRCEEKIQNERIQYTGYLEGQQDYINWLSSLDAIVVPDEVTTTGPLTRIVEPMACAIPVFTTHKGVAGLYRMEPGKNILVFDVTELVNKINELIFDDCLMREIGTEARRVAERYYSRKANKEKLTKILGLINTESMTAGHN